MVAASLRDLSLDWDLGLFPAVLVPLGHEDSDEPFDLPDLGVSFFNGSDTVKADQIRSNQAVTQPQP